MLYIIDDEKFFFHLFPENVTILLKFILDQSTASFRTTYFSS